MASTQNSVQNSQTRTVQHNHVIIQYQQPPDLAIVKPCFGDIGSCCKKLCLKKNLVQIPYIQDYIDQIVPIFTNSL